MEMQMPYLTVAMKPQSIVGSKATHACVRAEDPIEHFQ